MTKLQQLAVIFAVGAVLTPLAHVLELPNKLRLSGELWLAVQQQLYRGWGPFLGGPLEIGGLAVSLASLSTFWRIAPWLRRLYGVAVLAYLGMLVSFFLLNDPVNKALAGWTADTLPANWGRYRLSWEIGHAIAFVCAVIAAVASIAALRSKGRPPLI